MTENTLRSNFQAIQTRIDNACVRAGRDVRKVTLLPVTKTVSSEILRVAYSIGCRRFAENKVQEGFLKVQDLSSLTDLKWCVIGHLQSNKARKLVQFASEFHGLDSLVIAQELDRRLQALGKGLDVFVQVNTSAEQSKFGLPPEDVSDFVKQLTAFSALRVRGLMTLALNSNEEAQVRPCFVRLRKLREKLQQEAPHGHLIQELSMGMSGDFEWAIEEGATQVRIGQSLFGQRSQFQSR